MNWLPALLGLILQVGEPVDPWLILPPAVGPRFERIMAEQDLQSRLGPGWKFGDAVIASTAITIQVLWGGKPAAVITLERPSEGGARPPGRWFAHRVEILAENSPQLETALMQIAGDLDRGFGASPWKPPGTDAVPPRQSAAPEGVPCSFCSPVTQPWPFHYTRHPWIPLALGALIFMALVVGVYFGLRHSRALKEILP
jgi:hypothetical protein